MPTLDADTRRVIPSDKTEITQKNDLKNDRLSSKIDLDEARRTVEVQELYDVASVHQKVRAKNATNSVENQKIQDHTTNVHSKNETSTKATAKTSDERKVELIARNAGRTLNSEKEALKAIEKELNKTDLSAEAREKIRKKALQAFHETYTATKSNMPWYKRAGNCIAHPIRSSKKLAEASAKILHDPLTQSVVASVKEKTAVIAKTVASGVSYAVTHPLKTAAAIQNAAIDLTIRALKAAPQFLKSMSDSIGLTQCAYGVWSGIKGTSQLVLGTLTLNKDMIATGLSNLKQSTDAFIGAARVFAELTGLADLYYMGKYALQGRWGMVAMHAGFALMSVGTIAATVATGGAACGAVFAVAAGRSTVKAAAKTALKTGAESFVKSMSKDFTKNCLQELGQKITGEMCQAVAHEAAESAGKVVISATTRNGAEAAIKEICGDGAVKELQLLAKDIAAVGEETALKKCRERLTEIACDKYGYEAVNKIFKEVGAEETIATWTEKTLGVVKNKKLFMEYATTEMGLSKENAKKVFSEARKAIMSGKSDKEIVEIYGKDLKANLKEMLLKENGMTKEFEKTFKETLEKSGKLETEEVKKLTQKGTEAFENGACRSIDEVVEKGIKRGLKKLRHLKYAYNMPYESKLDSYSLEIKDQTIKKEGEVTKLHTDTSSRDLNAMGNRTISYISGNKRITEKYVDNELVSRNVETLHEINTRIAKEVKQMEEVAKKTKTPTNAA